MNTLRIKIQETIKSKLLKRYTCLLLIGVFTYCFIANIVLFYKLSNYTIPKFIISRITTDFHTAEYMHLLYTLQEINKVPCLSDELYKYTTQPYEKNYSYFLENKFLQFNWKPEAFFVRVKKLFTLYNTYDQVIRIDDTILIMQKDIKANGDSPYTYTQVNLLKENKQQILNELLTFEEYEFIKSNYNLIKSIYKL